MNCLKNCILIFVILFFTAGKHLLCAQNRSFAVDSLTTMIDGSYPPYDQVQAGDTLLFEHGMRAFILLRNFRGEADQPIVILNSGGIVKINTDHYYGISIRNCRYFKFSGTGDPNHLYGFMIERVAQGGGIGIGENSSDFELDHVSIENCHGVGVSAKTDPDCSFTNTRDQFTQFNTIIHDCYISSVSYEGMYIGSTKYFGQNVTCNGTDTLLMPGLLDGVRIYNNIIKYTGWDGIQVSSASNNCQVFDNLILYDSQDEYHNQMSGILLGGGSKCDCFNNYIGQGKGSGIENHGLGGNRIFNNIIVDAGRSFLPMDTSQMRHGIFVSDISMLVDSSVYILYNDIVNPKSDGIRFSSIKSRNNLVASNVIINPGNFDYYENGNTSFKGSDSYIMLTDHTTDVTVKNNYVARNTDGAGFSLNNYTLVQGSPLIDSAYNVTKGINFDFYHHPRPEGTAPDIGAFEFISSYLGSPDREQALNLKMLSFPNPAVKKLIIQYQVDLFSDVYLDVYTLQGIRVMSAKQTVSSNGVHRFHIDVENYKPGVYIFSLKAANYYTSGRFVKVN